MNFSIKYPFSNNSSSLTRAIKATFTKELESTPNFCKCPYVPVSFLVSVLIISI